MKIHLVIWEVQDSGFEIKGAFFDPIRAKAKAERLNALEVAAMIASTEQWIKDVGPDGVQRVYVGPKGERLSVEAATASCRASTKRSAAVYCNEHSVYTVKVL
jgi:hypothetical protein